MIRSSSFDPATNPNADSIHEIRIRWKQILAYPIRISVWKIKSQSV